MYIKVDYISFSVVWHDQKIPKDMTVGNLIRDNLLQLEPRLIEWLGLNQEWIVGGGRKPYSDTLRHPEGGVTMLYHPNLPHASFEISGVGCDRLWRQGDLYAVLNAVRERCSRVDVACDMKTDVTPNDFVAAGYSGRFKARSLMEEESGTTWYVGSRKSNRFARVYRYNAPHPRSHLLRVEYQTMGDDAKLTANAILAHSVESTAATLGEKFGWKHDLWDTSKVEKAELVAYRAERNQGKTLFWLADTIAPLLLKLHRERLIDVNQWVEENVYKHMTAEERAELGMFPF